MPERLTRPPEDVFIQDALLPSFRPSEVVGFDPTAAPGDSSFLPVGKSLDDVGSVFPHLTVQVSNQTTSGDTGYSFLQPDGTPGQDRTGQLLVTARAEERDGGYTANADQFSAVDARRLTDLLMKEVEFTTSDNFGPTDTEFDRLGSNPAADAPDDFAQEPTVRVEQITVLFSWTRTP
jgi:hypothetical protein